MIRLGFLAPTILVAKCLIQKLWLQGLEWDALPSRKIVDEWELYHKQLSILSILSIARYVIRDECVYVEVHGFCDASEVGYGAVLYLRHVLEREVVVSMLYSKNRVAPLKTMSIPRLELCAASLLSDCIAFVLSNITNMRVRRVFCWSDSTVTLAWIRSSPHRWKTFVANRVSHIQEQVAPECWNYVDGKVNPADCASRGIFPEQFVSHSLWWAGPPWLAESNSYWPNCVSSEILTAVTLEEKKVVYMAIFCDNFLSEILQKFWSLSKIQRIISYCLRFVNNLRNHKCEKQVGCLSYVELYKALIVIVRFVQNDVFSADILKLKEKVPCSKPLRKLVPFLDEDGVLRGLFKIC
ncbi:uncharacterized protein LOC115889201 [Sitophilus oryzae]|uniref:Uncharacterized protein LOC115889201 n=1 Tax=Sitophilus oryzae TaxID=7048 RepID=A0A6J2YNZ0_SITOR|nr:uncharacterized protein LOC115889201 [Sitophilus oryzae]